MNKLKKKNLKIDDAIDEENTKKSGNNFNKQDRIYNLADSQSVELYKKIKEKKLNL